MAGMIRVSPEELRGESATFNAQHAQINDVVAKLRSSVDSLRNNWQGQAQVAFDGHYQKWQQGINQVNEALNGISQLLKQAAATYEGADQTAARSFGG